MDSGNPADAIFLEVPHHRLALKLEAHDVMGKLLQWTVVWLKDKKQRICINGTKSIWQIVLSGVTQDSVLGPILFLIYTNDLHKGIWNWILKFADDTKIFSEVSTTSQHQKLQQDLDSLFYWSQEWQMLFIVQCRKIQCNAFWS